MQATLRAAMKRAADIIDGISEDDVLVAQQMMLSEGVSLAAVTKIDRALLASCHLRACAGQGENARITSWQMKEALAR